MRPIRSVLSLSLCALLLALSPLPAVAKTFYVDPVAGDDAHRKRQAKDPATAVKTVKRALSFALAGDTVHVLVTGASVDLADGGAIESKRDGTATAPITIRCGTPGACAFQPPAGEHGFFISHNYHVVDGFKVVNPRAGFRFGAHDNGDGPLFGGAAAYCSTASWRTPTATASSAPTARGSRSPS